MKKVLLIFVFFGFVAMVCHKTVSQNKLLSLESIDAWTQTSSNDSTASTAKSDSLTVIEGAGLVPVRDNVKLNVGFTLNIESKAGNIGFEVDNGKSKMCCRTKRKFKDSKCPISSQNPNC